MLFLCLFIYLFRFYTMHKLLAWLPECLIVISHFTYPRRNSRFPPAKFLLKKFSPLVTVASISLHCLICKHKDYSYCLSCPHIHIWPKVSLHLKCLYHLSSCHTNLLANTLVLGTVILTKGTAITSYSQFCMHIHTQYVNTLCMFILNVNQAKALPCSVCSSGFSSH